MSREDLTTWLTRFGWTKTGELPGVCENWEPPTDVRDTWVTVPLRQDASDYEHYMRRAWNTLGRHEGPRLLAVVRALVEARRDLSHHHMHRVPGRWDKDGSFCDVCARVGALDDALSALTEGETDAG